MNILDEGMIEDKKPFKRFILCFLDVPKAQRCFTHRAINTPSPYNAVGFKCLIIVVYFNNRFFLTFKLTLTLYITITLIEKKTKNKTKKIIKSTLHLEHIRRFLIELFYHSY